MKPSLSTTTVNRLYLATIILVLILGSLMQSASFSWGLLGTEVLLILLPSLFVLRRSKLPMRQVLRLNPIDPLIILAALLIGIGAWLVDAFLGVVVIQLSGYSVTVANAAPQNMFQAILAAVAFSIAAPICEEVLFRGLIQGSYEAGRSAKKAIVIAGLMFAFYHMQLQGLLALLPVAFLLGYVAWRTRSLYASILVHFANNSMASLLIIVYALSPRTVLPFPSLPAAGIGLLLILIGLFLLQRSDIPAPEVPAQVEEHVRRSWLAKYWPLLVGGLLYIVVAGIEVVTFARPDLITPPGLPPAGPVEAANLDLKYEIRNKADQPVGEMNCTRSLQGDEYLVGCTMQISAYELQIGNSYYSSSGAVVDWKTTVSSANLRLDSLEGKVDFINGSGYTWQAVPHGEELLLQVQDSTQGDLSLSVPAVALLAEEWPLRLMAASFDNLTPKSVALAMPMTYRPETQDSGTSLTNMTLVVLGMEEVNSVKAYRVSVGKYMVWYAVESPHVMLKFDNGVETFTLK